MGNVHANSSTGPGAGFGDLKVKPEHPQQFVAQSRGDWSRQYDKLLRTGPTLTKSVVLPPGVTLDDPRLAHGEIVKEERFTIEEGEEVVDPALFPPDVPFEVDISGKLIPPAWGRRGVPAHYAVYPDQRFAGVSRCEFCSVAGIKPLKPKHSE